MSERLTPERLAYLRRLSAIRALSCDNGSELLAELDAVTKERDQYELERDAWKTTAKEYKAEIERLKALSSRTA